MSFGKGGDDKKQKKLLEAQTQQAQALAQVAQGPIAAQALQTPVLDIFKSFLAGGRPTLFSPMFASTREALEGQFDRAREAVIQTSPARGGLQTRMLGDLETERARTVTGIESDFVRFMFPAAASLAFGTPMSAVPALSSAGAQFGSLAARLAAEQQAQGQAMGQFGALAGMGAAKGAGGKGAFAGAGAGAGISALTTEEALLIGSALLLA